MDNTCVNCGGQIPEGEQCCRSCIRQAEYAQLIADLKANSRLLKNALVYSGKPFLIEDTIQALTELTRR